MATIGKFGNPNPGPVQQDIATDLAAIVAAHGMDDGVVTGLTIGTPSSSNSQASGTGATVWRVNIAAGIVRVDGVELAQGAQADFSLHATDCLVAASQDCWARVLEQNSAGTLSTVVVLGTAAATGLAVEPTDAEVDTALSALPWIELGRALLSRNSGTTLTVVYDHGHRHVQAGNALATVDLATVNQ